MLSRTHQNPEPHAESELFPLVSDGVTSPTVGSGTQAPGGHGATRHFSYANLRVRRIGSISCVHGTSLRP